MMPAALKDQSKIENRKSKMSAPEVSFVVPSYRSRATVGETLGAIFSQQTSLSFEVVVVDSSPQDLGPWLEENYPRVRLASSERRLYPGAARNLGAQTTSGRWLGFLDADAAPQPDWLETLHARLQDAKWRMAGGWIGNANPETTASRILHWIEFSECLPGRDSGPRRALSSSNLLVSREDFLRAGGFPEEMAMAEDLAFCARLGGGLFFESGTGVWHRHREDWPEVKRHLERLGRWSGRLRRGMPTSGSWLAKAPFLVWLLPFYRAARIAGRVIGARPADAFTFLVGLPSLLRGLFSWARGFRWGLRD